MVKTDFFISPAYMVPAIMTMPRLKLMAMQVSELVPSSAGMARKVGANRMVNLG